MDIQERLTAFAMLGATWVMWLLIGLSVIMLGIVFERAYYYLASSDDFRRLRDDIAPMLKKGDLRAVSQRLERSRSFEAKVLGAGIDWADRGPEAAAESMTSATQLAKLNMERNLAFLGTVGNNAPFVGLLGTVIGIIRSFHELNQSAGKLSDTLMSEVGEALVATAIGIIVAIPSVAFFNFFQRVIRARLAQAETLNHELMAHLRSDKPIPQPSAAE
ncbi:MAG: MotA/TolQ/ExbB proton channel family protein [Myxococcaceae bacterium]|nr:MotA/TolQ/ExbB proton channel family protein [Myxococcaceae bacterium]